MFGVCRLLFDGITRPTFWSTVQHPHRHDHQKRQANYALRRNKGTLSGLILRTRRSPLQQERITKVVELGRVRSEHKHCWSSELTWLFFLRQTALHYGWIPFIIYVGFTRSNPQPSLIMCVLFFTPSRPMSLTPTQAYQSTCLDTAAHPSHCIVYVYSPIIQTAPLYMTETEWT